MANFYFRNFPFIKYSFGDDEPEVYFQKMSAAIDLFDNIKQDVSFATKQTILDFERPDTLSYRLYKTVDYYWTFFLMNDKLRESGWPLHTDREQEVIEERYPYWAFSTNDFFSGLLSKDQELFLTGNNVNQYGSVVRSDPSKGQIIFAPKYQKQNTIDPNGPRQDVSQAVVNSAFPGITGVQFETNNVLYNLASFQPTVLEYNGTHHWETSLGDYADYYPLTGDISGLTKVTYKENFQARNQDLREIAVLRPGIVGQVVGEFQKLIRT